MSDFPEHPNSARSRMSKDSAFIGQTHPHYDGPPCHIYRSDNLPEGEPTFAIRERVRRNGGVEWGEVWSLADDDGILEVRWGPGWYGHVHAKNLTTAPLPTTLTVRTSDPEAVRAALADLDDTEITDG